MTVSWATLSVTGGSMALIVRRNAGMLLLGIWLILEGIAGLIPIGLPSPLMSVLALIAGALILTGR
jgi:hypothetical protein